MRQKKNIIAGNPITFLEENWPGKRTKKVKDAFATLKNLVNSLLVARREEASEREGGDELSEIKLTDLQHAEPFNILDLIRSTCSTLDMLFLSKQITYHIAASSELSAVYANPEQLQSVLSELLRNIIKGMPHGERVDISLKEIPMRNGHGIEVAVRSVDKSNESASIASFLKKLFGESGGTETTTMFACREAIIKQGGQLSVDLPKPKEPLYRVVLPTVGTPSLSAAEQKTFKYQITITNIASVRKRFGIKKSHGFVAQIENYIRSLVRHPIDIVMAEHDKGVITAIYDSPKGNAQSVASRISQRLGSEEFKIGKKIVDVSFKYQLSALPKSEMISRKI